MRALPVVLVLLATVSLAAQPLDDFERVLIPAFAQPAVTGVNGARFESMVQLWAPAGTRYFPSYLGDPRAPAIGAFPYPYTHAMFIGTPPSRVGRFLYIEQPVSGHTALHAFLMIGPSGRPDHMLRLPIVREHDFHSTAFSILGVTSAYSLEDVPGTTCRIANPLHRHTLRVYDFDGRGGAVRVRVFGESIGGLLRMDETLQIASREGDDPTYPLYAEMQISELCAGVSCHTPCLSGHQQRVEITPLTEGLRVWAVVSETHNVTQDVTLLYAE